MTPTFAERTTPINKSIAKVAVQLPGEEFVVKIGTFAKPETNPWTRVNNEQNT